MKCPLCEEEMQLGVMEVYRAAPTWVSADKKIKFAFGQGKLLRNVTPNVWHCPACDAVLIERAVNKIVWRDSPSNE